MENRNPFGDRLRALRHTADKTMGEVARALEVSVVYYSDVENGRRQPFPRESSRYEKLAQVLGGDAHELSDLAECSRKMIEINLTELKQDEVQVTLALARKLRDKSLSPEMIVQLKDLLKGTHGQ